MAKSQFQLRLARYWGTESLVPLEDLVATRVLLDEAAERVAAQR
jgi:hypothetical protein